MARTEYTDADVWVAVSPEVLFAGLPFIVFAIVLWAKGDFAHFFYMPELSLASAVLLGQGIARFTSGVLVSQIKRPAYVVLILTSTLVLGLVPVLVVLVLVLMAPQPSANLAWAQGLLFVWALILYAFMAGFGQMLLEEERTKSSSSK